LKKVFLDLSKTLIGRKRSFRQWKNTTVQVFYILPLSRLSCQKRSFWLLNVFENPKNFFQKVFWPSETT